MLHHEHVKKSGNFVDRTEQAPLFAVALLWNRIEVETAQNALPSLRATHLRLLSWKQMANYRDRTD
jgi:hypothetical protein